MNADTRKKVSKFITDSSKFFRGYRLEAYATKDGEIWQKNKHGKWDGTFLTMKEVRKVASPGDKITVSVTDRNGGNQDWFYIDIPNYEDGSNTNCNKRNRTTR